MEIRWCYHNFADHGPPTEGAIHISGGLYQKLQYRTILNHLEIGLHEPIWSEWKDVTFGRNK